MEASSNPSDFSKENLPPNIKGFLQRNTDVIKEDAKIRQGQIRQLVGESDNPEDIAAAKEIVAEAALYDPTLWQERRKQGLITVTPPQGDKHFMIGLETPDSEVYEIFNRAASRITKPYQGFHQIGAIGNSGYTSWELWNMGENKFYEIIEQMYEDMEQIAQGYSV